MSAIPGTWRRWTPSPPDVPVLLIGTGLSAIDVCMTLMNASPGTDYPHGVAPRPAAQGPPQRTAAPLLARAARDIRHAGAPVRQLLKAFRQHARAIEAEGEDWREALNLLRPGTAVLWQGWSDAERRRFLRHVQPYWDNHRHRAAPRPHARFEEAVKAGRIQVHAGRIAAFTDTDEGVSVLLRLRGSGAQRSLDAAYVVNCIGPDCDLRKTGNPLVQRLLAEGAIQPDRLGLGIEVDEECRVVRADGGEAAEMYYIGPLLKARYWEATAVPELRRFCRAPGGPPCCRRPDIRCRSPGNGSGAARAPRNRQARCGTSGARCGRRAGPTPRSTRTRPPRSAAGGPAWPPPRGPRR